MTTDPHEGEPAENLVLRGRSLLAVGVIALGIARLARPILGPFIVAGVIAYAFSPVVTTVQHRSGLPRIAIVGSATDWRSSRSGSSTSSWSAGLFTSWSSSTPAARTPWPTRSASSLARTRS
jgi:hypothetical protein